MAMYKGEAKIKDIYVGTEPIVKVYAGEEFCGFFTLSAYNIVANSDLLIDSNSDGVPDGFTYNYATDISLTNGIAKFTATEKNGFFGKFNFATIGKKYYQFCRVKADSNYVRMSRLSGNAYHSGSGNFEYLSVVGNASYGSLTVDDNRTSGWTPIEIDYIGVINITDLVSRGILPSGLTDAQYKTILDNYFNS